MNTYPALRGKFGTTDYHVVTMQISELVNLIQFPSDEDWEDTSLEGQFQRKLDLGRIKKHIAPYFKSDERRFSSSVVVAAKDSSGMRFEPIGDIAREGLRAAYLDGAENIGFLTIKSQKFIPLDGQHRLKAFQDVLDEKGNSNLKDDIISVIVIAFDTSLARYIFNKINKYAKPTSKAGKLITDDDDAIAVISRSLISEGVIPRRLVNSESTSLNKNSHEFTLLATFYDANKALLPVLPVKVVKKPEDISGEERKKIQKDLQSEWERLFSGIDEWKNMLSDSSENGDKGRIEIRGKSILGKPIGQLSLIKGYANAYCKGIEKELLIGRLNEINWDISNDMWKGLLVKTNGRMMYGARVANMASNMISHMVGVELSSTIKNNLLDYVYGTNRKQNMKLPTPIGKKKPRSGSKKRRKKTRK